MSENSFNLFDNRFGCVVVIGGTLDEKQRCLSDILSQCDTEFDCALAQSRDDRLFTPSSFETALNKRPVDDNDTTTHWPIIPKIFRYDALHAHSLAALLNRQAHLLAKKATLCDTVLILDDEDAKKSNFDDKLATCLDVLREMSGHCRDYRILFVLFLQPDDSHTQDVAAVLSQANCIIDLHKKEAQSITIDTSTNTSTSTTAPYILPETIINKNLKLGSAKYWRYSQQCCSFTYSD